MSKDVFEIVARVMNVPLDSVSEDSSMDTLVKWDSLHHMNLILAVEEKMGIQFTDEDIISINNVSNLIERIKLRG